MENYIELEQALHKLLDPFRLNASREFFTDDALPFVERVVEIHKAIMAAQPTKPPANIFMD